MGWSEDHGVALRLGHVYLGQILVEQTSWLPLDILSTTENWCTVNNNETCAMNLFRATWLNIPISTNTFFNRKADPTLAAYQVVPPISSTLGGAVCLQGISRDI